SLSFPWWERAYRRAGQTPRPRVEVPPLSSKRELWVAPAQLARPSLPLLLRNPLRASESRENRIPRVKVDSGAKPMGERMPRRRRLVLRLVGTCAAPPGRSVPPRRADPWRIGARGATLEAGLSGPTTTLHRRRVGGFPQTDTRHLMALLAQQ